MSEKVLKTDVRFQVKQETDDLNWAYRLAQKNVEGFKMVQKRLLTKADYKRIGRGEPIPDRPVKFTIEFTIPPGEMKKNRVRHEKFVKSQQPTTSKV